MPFFSPETIEELGQARHDVHTSWHDLRKRVVGRNFANNDAREFARQGLARRLETLARCIDQVFDLLPPERDETVDATINTQSFISNAFGCLDNLAWMWVYEKGILDEDGKPLDKMKVGLDKKMVKQSFSQTFRDYLASRDRWFQHLKEFRDALGHRIPLYIPPHVVSPEHVAEYNRLETAMAEALNAVDIAAHDRFETQQQALVMFQPVMQHSLTQAKNPPVIFHSQLIIDFTTIDEMTRKLLDEMDQNFTASSMAQV